MQKQNQEIENCLWGFGSIVGLGDTNNFRYLGGKNGYFSQFIGYHNGDGVVVMCNGGNGQSLIDQIVRGISTAYQWKTKEFESKQITVSEKNGKLKENNQYIGCYSFDKDENWPKIRFYVEDGNLQFLNPLTREKIVLFQHDDSLFFHPNGTEIIFLGGNKLTYRAPLVGGLHMTKNKID